MNKPNRPSERKGRLQDASFVYENARKALFENAHVKRIVGQVVVEFLDARDEHQERMPSVVEKRAVALCKQRLSDLDEDSRTDVQDLMVKWAISLCLYEELLTRANNPR